jgi:endonuclease-8
VPEGDTLWRAARALHAALAGQVVTGFRSSQAAVAAAARRMAVVGDTVAAVEARGKHLLVRFARGSALHTHMRMRGSWHLYRPGSPWLRPAHQARVVLETPRAVAVCFAAPVVELLSPAAQSEHPRLGALGPDVLAPDFAAGEALARLRARPALEIADALLDQTALSGIGNVYKSEALFLSRLDPFAPVAAFDDEALARLVHTAERLMKGNLGPAPRRTTPPRAATRLWVYQRVARPCRRCGTLILMRRHGVWGRSTYWCPRCQPRLTIPEFPLEVRPDAPAARRRPHALQRPAGGVAGRSTGAGRSGGARRARGARVR